MNIMKYVTYLCVIMCMVAFSNCNSGSASVDGDKTEMKEGKGKKGKKVKKGMKGKKGKKGEDAVPVLKIGDTAPDFSLKGVDGKMTSLAGMKDAKGYIITFTCNHCPYSVMYEDRLIELHNKMSAKGYPVVAINPNDPAAEPKDSFDGMVERSKEKGFPFPYLFDDGQKIYPQYGASRTPHIFLLDADRKVRYIGAIDDSARDSEKVSKRYVEMAIEALEKGVEPTPSFTKAIGCSIKKV